VNEDLDRQVADAIAVISAWPDDDDAIVEPTIAEIATDPDLREPVSSTHALPYDRSRGNGRMAESSDTPVRRNNS
jgi:hypothetical protein